MISRYIRRTLEPVLQRAAREFPAIVLTGPRQFCALWPPGAGNCST
ncbi:MAG: hypothetical protein RKO24_14950 [Candidatus Competibacter sp.]|nr:hypothetical protein [Candidatus Competibacter sp.]